MKLSHQVSELFAQLRSRVSSITDEPASSREPIVRRMDFPFAEAELPRYWLGGNIIGTALANSLNLIFPDGERFFVRSVNHFMPEIEDPQLRERVKRFFGQEGQHAREHERFFAVMREQGYDIDPLLERYRHVAYEVLAPRVPAKLRLSITAALEHFTASFAVHALSSGLLEQHAPPVMVELLKWHAAEEIEHKDVAYDVLMQVDDSYLLRVTGLVAAVVVLWGFWAYFTIELLRQEPGIGRSQLARDGVQWAVAGQGPGMSMPLSVLQYLAPNFHPSHIANDELALRYLESIGRRQG